MKNQEHSKVWGYDNLRGLFVTGDLTHRGELVHEVEGQAIIKADENNSFSLILTPATGQDAPRMDVPCKVIRSQPCSWDATRHEITGMGVYFKHKLIMLDVGSSTQYGGPFHYKVVAQEESSVLPARILILVSLLVATLLVIVFWNSPLSSLVKFMGFFAYAGLFFAMLGLNKKQAPGAESRVKIKEDDD